MHFSPFSITSIWEESIAIARAIRNQAEKRTIAASGVEHPLIHIDINNLRAALPAFRRRDNPALRQLLFLIRRLNWPSRR